MPEDDWFEGNSPRRAGIWLFLSALYLNRHVLAGNPNDCQSLSQNNFSITIILIRWSLRSAKWMYKFWNYPNYQIIGKAVSQTCKPVLSELHSRNHLGFWLQTIYHFRHYTIPIIRHWPRKILKLMPVDHVYCRINDFQTFLWEVDIILL